MACQEANRGLIICAGNETTDKAGKTYQESRTSQSRLDLLLKPLIKYFMQVDICH